MKAMAELHGTCSCCGLQSTEPAAGQSLAGSGGFLRRHFIEPFRSSRHPPWFDARGVAMGLFLGLGIPLGAQMVLMGILRLVFRFNAALAFAFTWVNNPFTVVPMYYGYYCLGSRLLGKPATLNVDAFRNLLNPVLQAGYFWESVHSFLYLGRDVIVRWALGAVLVATVCAFMGYVVSYRVQKARADRIPPTERGSHRAPGCDR
jgi:uncharacterized protein